MKSYLRWSKCSGSTKARILRIVNGGTTRSVRRSVSAKRRQFIQQGASDA